MNRGESFSGRVALVAGGTGGLGRAVSLGHVADVTDEAAVRQGLE